TIAVLLGQIETSSGATTRNRLRSTLSAFYVWAIAEGLTEVNPVQGTAKADEGSSRERVLSQEELKALSSAFGTGSFADVVRLLILTGARRNEIDLLKWSEIDLARKMIVLPPNRVKNDREHSLPLSSQALGIIERLPRRNSTDHVFNDKGFQDWNRAKVNLDERLDIAPWRIHDLRRTCATGMAELGVQPHIIEAVLNQWSQGWRCWHLQSCEICWRDARGATALGRSSRPNHTLNHALNWRAWLSVVISQILPTTVSRVAHVFRLFD